MKKVLYIVLALFLILSSGCNARQQTKEGDVEGAKGTTASLEFEQTNSLVEKSGTEPVYSPAPGLNTALAPAPMPEIGCGLSIEEFASVLLDSDPEIFFNSHDSVAQDKSGTIYYIDHGAVYSIDNDSGEKVKMADEDIIEKEIDFGIEYEYFSIYKIFCIDGFLYAAVEIVNPDYNYNYSIINVSNMKIVDIPEGFVSDCYDDRLIMYYYDYDTAEGIYFIYDLGSKERIEMFDSIDGHKRILLKYASDRYLVFDTIKRIKQTDGSYERSYLTVIVDGNSMSVVTVIDGDELDIANVDIFSCWNDWMLYFDNVDNAVKLYNIETQEIAACIDFYGETKMLGYDSKDKCLYLRQSVGYSHRADNLFEEDYHWWFDECIDKEELDSAKESFVKLDLMTLETETIYTANTTDYMADDMCLGLIDDFMMKGYVFAYYPVLESEGEPSEYFYARFELGQEIDFETWEN